MEILTILGNLMDPALLLTLLVCTLYGALVGALPGLSATMAVALLVPFTFYMDPVQAIAAIIATTSTAIFAGDISGALLRVPGTPASAAYNDDAYKIAASGQARTVLFTALFTGVMGGIIGVLMLWMAAPLMARVATNFSSYEMFWLAALGLSCAVFVADAPPAKTMASLFIGLAIACVGIDVAVGIPRFTFGFDELYDGVEFISAMIGFFAMTELIRNLGGPGVTGANGKPALRMEPVGEAIRGALRQIRRWWLSVVRSSPIGVVIGVLPGAGADVAAWVTYALSRRLSKTPARFGKGHYEGLVDAGSANNASIAGAWTPALIFGIPGDSVTAIAIGVLTMKGLAPGPDIFMRNGEMVHTIFGAFMLSNFFMLLSGAIAIVLASHLLRMPRATLMPLVLMLSLIGGFAVTGSPFSIWIMLVLGGVGYLMCLAGIPLAPAILGIVLGEVLERNFMTSMIKSGGDFSAFFERSVSLGLGVLTIIVWAMCLWRILGGLRRGTAPRVPH